MARIALTLAGGLIGGLLALPTGGISVGVGFSLGSAVGSLAGGLLFPGKGTHTYGPRVTDMNISGATPGTPIPILFGTMRLGGTFIWTNGLEEVATTTKQSAKGGPSVVQTTYAYFASFAVAFCEGEADITRVWGDSKLIYDATGSGQLSKDVNTVPTFYRGTETQTADPLIVSFEDADKTPAYRGVCYAVWERFPLANFGNRIPNIRAEVTANSTQSYPLTRQEWAGGTDKPFYVAISPDGMTAFVYAQWHFNGSSSPAGTWIARVDLVSGDVENIAEADISNLPGYTTADTPGGADGALAVDNEGFLWGWGVIGGVKSLIKMDGRTFRGVTSVPITTATSTPFALYPYIAEDGTCSIVGFYDEGIHGGVREIIVVRCSDATVTGYFKDFKTPVNGVPVFAQQYPVTDDEGNVYVLGQAPSNGDDWYIWKIQTASGTSGAIFANVTRHVFTGTSSLGLGRMMYWNPDDSTLIVLTNTGAIHRIDPDSGEILETAGSASSPKFYVSAGASWEQNTIGAGWLNDADNSIIQAMRGWARNGIFWAPVGVSGTQIGAFSASSLTEESVYDITNYSNVPHTPQEPGFAYDAVANSIVFAVTHDQATGYPGSFATPYAIYRALLNRVAVGEQGADVIITALAERCGLSPSDLDVTDIADVGVLGFPITTLAQAKDSMSVLAQSLFFEGRESDFKLRFIKRGSVSVVTIPEADLGLVEDAAALEETLGQVQDVPKSVEVQFIDPALDYQQNNQVKVRHSATTSSQNQTSVNLPVVMTAADAMQTADKMLWIAEAERRAFKLNLWKALYLLLDPCDVVKFVYHANTLSARIIDDTKGQNFATALDLVSEDSDYLVTSAPGNSDSGFVPQFITGLAKSLLWMLDIPYLQDGDADAAGNTGFYFGMDPASGGSWRAGVVYRSSDKASWDQIASSDRTLAYGVLQAALAAPSTVCGWDEANSLIVQMNAGDAPTSATRLNVLNGANAAILYPSLEVIQFRDVTDNMDGTYTLAGLLRGRRGTEGFASSHPIGEMILFPLIQGGLVHKQDPSALIGAVRYYRPITVGADINSNPVSVPVTLNGNDLKPYSPAALTATPSGGDVLLSWYRRTRLGGQWADGTGSIPLSEDSELYDVEIYDDTATLVRTYAGIAPPSGTDSWSTPDRPHKLYTAADQTTDGYSSGLGWTAKCYQLSGQVGRGFPAEVALP